MTYFFAFVLTAICLSLQLIVPFPAQIAAPFIAFLWLAWGESSALLAAFIAGFFLDVLSFETPFGLFLSSYLLSTWISCRIKRFFFQSPYLTYMLFASLLSLLAPLIEWGFIMIRFHTLQTPAEALIWHVAVPFSLDIGLAALLGLPLIHLLLKRRALR